MPTPSRSPSSWRPGTEAANPRTGTVGNRKTEIPTLALDIHSAAPVDEVRAYGAVANSGAATGMLAYAVMRGTTPNSKIILDLVDPSANNAELAISVAGSTITVSLATGEAGAITTTGAALATALNADSAASKLIYAVSAGTVPGAVAVTDQTVTLANGVVGDCWPEGTLWVYVNSALDNTVSVYISRGEVTLAGALKEYKWLLVTAKTDDDLTVTDNLAVGGLCTIAETLGVTGLSTLATLAVTTPTTIDYRLASVSVNVGSATAQTLYTVPAGRSCVITKIVMRSAAASLNQATDPVFSIGWNATDHNDVVASATYTYPAATTTYKVLSPIANEAAIGAAAAVLKANVTTAATASTAVQFDVFGYLF